jgi:hypothetical protein
MKMFALLLRKVSEGKGTHLLIDSTRYLQWHIQISYREAREHLHNSLSSWCCLILISISVLKTPDAFSVQSKFLSQNQGRLCPLLKVMFRFLCFLKGAYFEFQNFFIACVQVNVCSATRNILHCHMYEIVFFVSYSGCGDKRHNWGKTREEREFCTFFFIVN